MNFIIKDWDEEKELIQQKNIESGNLDKNFEEKQIELMEVTRMRMEIEIAKHLLKMELESYKKTLFFHQILFSAMKFAYESNILENINSTSSDIINRSEAKTLRKIQAKNMKLKDVNLFLFKIFII